MFSGALLMLLSSAFLMLRLGPSGGSFPRPLTAEEEKHYLALWQEGLAQTTYPTEGRL